MRDIYMDMNRLQEYFKYTEALGVGRISTSQQDSLAFVTAENFYLENRCEEAQKALSNYFNQFKEGGYQLQANYYAAQCALRSKDNEKALNHLEYLINFQDNQYTDEPCLMRRALFMIKQITKKLPITMAVWHRLPMKVVADARR